MKVFPILQEYKEMTREFNLIPVYHEIPVDMETPISIFLKVCEGRKNNFLLESVEGGESLARYSFIGLDPFLKFSYSQGKGSIVEGEQTTVIEGPPLGLLKEIIQRYHAPQLENLPRFYGGAVGYFGYDLVRYVEELPYLAQDDLDVPDCFFLLTETVLIFDHVRHSLKVVINTRPDSDNYAEKYQEALDKIKEVIRLLAARLPFSRPQTEQKPELPGFKSNMTKEEFTQKVLRAKEYIRQGDIFQVVLSQRFALPVIREPFAIYRSLRTINPAPYLYFLNFEDNTIIGSSPEMLIRVEDGLLETRPIAGTRPRGSNLVQDREYELELLADTKEKAEHLMLVDLGRNDVGRVAQPGTVKLTSFMEVERYSHVMHLVSIVQGSLRAERNAFDALEACFPAGTVSGAPKVRAMEIIEELEPTRRAVYAGAIGYFGFTGNLDTCITIRTIMIKGNTAYVQAGAGIVADSDPEREYQETINKAMALLKILQLQEEPA